MVQKVLLLLQLHHNLTPNITNSPYLVVERSDAVVSGSSDFIADAGACAIEWKMACNGPDTCITIIIAAVRTTTYCYSSRADAIMEWLPYNPLPDMELNTCSSCFT